MVHKVSLVSIGVPVRLMLEIQTMLNKTTQDQVLNSPTSSSAQSIPLSDNKWK